MRSWQLLAENEPKTVTTADLAQYRACSFLGAAGLGKTVELEYLAEIERAEGLDVRSTRLGDLQ